jgi:hypothetical protein
LSFADFAKLRSGLISRDDSGQAVTKREVRDQGHFLALKVGLSILVAERMKLAPLDHLQDDAATTVQQSGHVFDGKVMKRKGFGIGRPETSIEQVRQPVFEDGRFLSHFGGG